MFAKLSLANAYLSELLLADIVECHLWLFVLMHYRVSFAKRSFKADYEDVLSPAIV